MIRSQDRHLPEYLTGHRSRSLRLRRTGSPRSTRVSITTSTRDRPTSNSQHPAATRGRNRRGWSSDSARYLELRTTVDDVESRHPERRRRFPGSPACPLSGEETLWIGDDGSAANDAAVAPRRCCSIHPLVDSRAAALTAIRHRQQFADDPLDDRRLARAAGGKISHADDRSGQARADEQLPIKEMIAPAPDDRGIDRLDTTEQPAQDRRADAAPGRS